MDCCFGGENGKLYNKFFEILLFLMVGADIFFSSYGIIANSIDLEILNRIMFGIGIGIFLITIIYSLITWFDGDGKMNYDVGGCKFIHAIFELYVFVVLCLMENTMLLIFNLLFRSVSFCFFFNVTFSF